MNLGLLKLQAHTKLLIDKPDLTNSDDSLNTRTLLNIREFNLFTRILEKLSNVLAISDRKSTRLNSSHVSESRMPSSA